MREGGPGGTPDLLRVVADPGLSCGADAQPRQQHNKWTAHRLQRSLKRKGDGDPRIGPHRRTKEDRSFRDPGRGFAKPQEQNLSLLSSLNSSP
ncbi:MAG: hypothetical protein CM15mP77_0990 [Synechococcus sp.]|nr:MAG: hypothetical protein CM15mP77_0990 [Synechococcus sp.]